MQEHPHPCASIGREQILKAAASIGMLGTTPSSAPRIMAALCNPEIGAGEVAGMLRQEPALYARVLRVANSPYYGQSRSITTLERALVLMGLDAVRGIAAAACLDRAVPRGSEKNTVIDLRALVHHSIATAAAAESLAKIHQPTLASEAFIAGLLHNLGIVVQLHLDSPGIAAMIDQRKLNNVRDMRELEIERAAVGHEECIAVVFEAWNMPAGLIAATRHHHDPMATAEPHRGLSSLINLGANLGLACGNTFTLEPSPVERHEPAMQWLGLSGAQVDTVAETLPRRVSELRHALVDA